MTAQIIPFTPRRPTVYIELIKGVGYDAYRIEPDGRRTTIFEGARTVFPCVALCKSLPMHFGLVAPHPGFQRWAGRW